MSRSSHRASSQESSGRKSIQCISCSSLPFLIVSYRNRCYTHAYIHPPSICPRDAHRGSATSPCWALAGFFSELLYTNTTRLFSLFFKNSFLVPPVLICKKRKWKWTIPVPPLSSGSLPLTLTLFLMTSRFVMLHIHHQNRSISIIRSSSTCHTQLAAFLMDLESNDPCSWSGQLGPVQVR